MMNGVYFCVLSSRSVISGKLGAGRHVLFILKIYLWSVAVWQTWTQVDSMKQQYQQLKSSKYLCNKLTIQIKVRTNLNKYKQYSFVFIIIIIIIVEKMNEWEGSWINVEIVHKWPDPLMQNYKPQCFRH